MWVWVYLKVVIVRLCVVIVSNNNNTTPTATVSYIRINGFYLVVSFLPRLFLYIYLLIKYVFPKIYPFSGLFSFYALVYALLHYFMYTLT